MSQIVDKLFNVSSAKTMYFGATLIDSDPRAGYVEDIMATSKHDFNTTPISMLHLYPEIEEKIIDEGKGQPFPLAMACTWINGFAPMQRGLPDAENMPKGCKDYLSGKSIVTTDQIFRARQDEFLHSLLAHMKWYGATGDNGRLLDKTFMDEKFTGNCYRKGLACPHWATNPVNIKWMVKLNTTVAENNDYVYLVGGSNDILTDNVEEFVKTVSSLYDNIKSYQDENAKSPDKSKSSISSSPKHIWFANKDDEFKTTIPLFKAHLAAKKLYRMLQGIFLIHNYFIYIQKNLKEIGHVIEVDYNSKTNEPVFKKVEIQEIITKLDKIYSYSKNLCYVYGSDIGNSTIVS